MDSSSLLWITTVIMAGGGLLILLILLIGERRTTSEEMQTVLHGIVPLIAACSCLAMATGQGLMLLPGGAGARGPSTTRATSTGASPRRCCCSRCP